MILYCDNCKKETEHIKLYEGIRCSICYTLYNDIIPLNVKQANNVIPKINIDVHIEQKPVPVGKTIEMPSVGIFKKLWYLYLNKSVSYIPLVLKVIGLFVPQVQAVNILWNEINPDQSTKQTQTERIQGMDWNSLKQFIVPFIARWILHVGSGVIATLGISSGSALEVITSIVMFIIGTIISLVNHNTAINTPPPTA